ncbi:Linear gramicidin synthase subunit D [Pseudomonas brassicacearum]|nr:Linear gramicidin synthase subunit D [Pseudomonas brassicacearum]
MASYGLAEATLFVAGTPRRHGIASLRVDDAALAQNRAEPGRGSAVMSCGVSQPGHAVLIVGPATLQPLADNQVGEVWAAGPSIALGYWRNPEASAKTFVQHDGRTWLRTGDLGFRRGGKLFVTGRLKDLLIVRGHNLYPQDIEQTIEREVEVVRKGRVAAFAVNDCGEEGIGIAAEISRSVQKILPPEALIKAIRQAAPGNELEQTLADIWVQVLKVERVGVRDNFFELGGHSLLATQIASRVQKALQRNVPLRAMFECSTVQELADYIDGLAASEITEEKVDRLNDLMAELEGM